MREPSPSCGMLTAPGRWPAAYSSGVRTSSTSRDRSAQAMRSPSAFGSIVAGPAAAAVNAKAQAASATARRRMTQPSSTKVTRMRTR